MLPAPAATQPASPEAGTSSGGHCFVPPRCRAARVRFDLRPTESPVANYATFVLECRTRTQSKSGFSRCGSRSPLGDVFARCGARMGVSGARAFLRFSRSVTFCMCPRPRAFTALAGARAGGGGRVGGRARGGQAGAGRARERGGAGARGGARASLPLRAARALLRARERECVWVRAGACQCAPPHARVVLGKGVRCPPALATAAQVRPTDTAANAHASSTAPELT